MTNKTFKVVKDICHEKMGTSSRVGETVVVIAELPGGTPISIYDRDTLQASSPVRYTVYLTVGGGTRFLDHLGNLVDRTIVARVGEAMYEGNDVYTAEELEAVE